MIAQACLNNARMFDKGRNICKEDIQAGRSIRDNTSWACYKAV